jgi:hypothetical protein
MYKFIGNEPAEEIQKLEDKLNISNLKSTGRSMEKRNEQVYIQEVRLENPSL